MIEVIYFIIIFDVLVFFVLFLFKFKKNKKKLYKCGWLELEKLEWDMKV